MKQANKLHLLIHRECYEQLFMGNFGERMKTRSTFLSLRKLEAAPEEATQEADQELKRKLRTLSVWES